MQLHHEPASPSPLGPELAPPASSWLACDHADGLRELQRPGVNVVHWPRTLDPALADALARLTPPKSEHDAQLHTTGDFEADAARLLDASPWAGADLRAPLAADLTLLMRAFARVTEAHTFAARLEWVLGEKCPKLHVDHCRARLVTAYLGPGTCWAPNKDARRNMLGAASARLCDPNAAILPDPKTLQRAAAGDIVLMKGNAWPGEPNMGAIHRSPHADHAHFARLVLVLTTREAG